MFREIVLLNDTLLLIELEGDRYRLNWGDLVVYEPGRRRVRGRSTAYEFRSIEQLRYDFEQDVASLG